MRKMKDSGIPWIGKYPEKWKVLKLKNTGSYRSGESITASLISEEGQYPVFGGNGLRGYTEKHTHEGYYVLIGRQGALCGNVHFVKGQFWASEHAVVCDINPDYDVKFMYYLLDGMNLNQYSESAAQPGISVERVVNLFVPIPASKNDQLEIAAYLDYKCGQIDSVIAAKEKTNEALKAYRQSVIYEAVTKGLDPAAPLKDTNIPWIGKIPCSWNVSRLKYLLRSERGAIKAGPFGSSLQAQDMRGSDVKVYNQRTVLDNDFTSGDDYVSFEKYRELLGFRVDSGDLLVTTRGTIGKTAIVPMNFQPGILHPCLIKLKLNEQVVNLKLLSLVFNSTNILLEQLRLASNATTIDVIYTHNLLDILFPLAPVHQQTEILKCLNDKCGQIDAVLAANEAIVKKLREYRQSLIYEAVTGKIACD